MEKVKKYLERALLALQLAKLEKDRLALNKKPVVIDDVSRAILDKIIGASTDIGNPWTPK
jgi:hypothetical protein